MKYLALAVGLLLMGGCGITDISTVTPSPTPAPAPECLTFDDVLDIPPGDSSDTVPTREYVVVSNLLQSCRECPENTVSSACDSFSPTVEEGTVIAVSQDGGILIIESSTDRATGAVNQDGTLAVGTLAPVVDDDGETIGQGLARLEGRFVDDWIVMETVIHHLTANTDDGVLDVQTTCTATYQLIN